MNGSVYDLLFLRSINLLFLFVPLLLEFSLNEFLYNVHHLIILNIVIKDLTLFSDERVVLSPARS